MEVSILRNVDDGCSLSDLVAGPLKSKKSGACLR